MNLLCRLKEEDIPKITVHKLGKTYVTENNRRLYVFRKAEKCKKISDVPVNLQTETDPERFANVYDEVTFCSGKKPSKRHSNETEYSTLRKKDEKAKLRQRRLSQGNREKHNKGKKE